MSDKKALAILSVSMITILGSLAVAPALAGIKSAFPQMGDEQIQLVLTITPLFIIPSCFLCKYFTERIGMKKVLILGIILYLIGGVGAGLMPNFYMMLAGRAVLGIGCGLVTPMAQALISAHFSGRKKERLIGYSASASYLMGIISSVIVGKLVGIHWRLAFAIYFVALLTLGLNLRYLPNDSAGGINRNAKEVNQKFNWKAFLVILSMGLINVAFYTFSVSISLFMKQEGIGGTSSSGSVVAAFMLFGFLIGLITDKLRSTFKQFIFALACIMMGTGYAGLAVCSDIILIAGFAALIGGSYSIFYSGVFLKIGQLSGTKDENTKLVTFMTASMFIGQSLCVYILQLVERVLGQSGYRFRFTFLAVMLGIAAVGIIFNGVYRRKDLKNCAVIIEK
ncbi:MFS transporter [Petroclostridium sp. X23]|uniref:MFS transporter n=1 Tax=Petroclostridium sp. X23 TaxID=3045146 RepID=UPI0024AD2976|nr:MFS transporter [Petroclostridium sp. X23]WHH57795.1 MFS transporter [Petroclostridium sp. X23]